MHAFAKKCQKDSPVQPTEENLTAGAKLYRDHCAVCHGTVDQPKTATAKGMFPLRRSSCSAKESRTIPWARRNGKSQTESDSRACLPTRAHSPMSNSGR